MGEHKKEPRQHNIENHIVYELCSLHRFEDTEGRRTKSLNESETIAVNGHQKVDKAILETKIILKMIMMHSQSDIISDNKLSFLSYSIAASMYCLATAVK